MTDAPLANGPERSFLKGTIYETTHYEEDVGSRDSRGFVAELGHRASAITGYSGMAPGPYIREQV